ncbi:MAG: DUF3667 domain-containing protein [Bacteroidota bacterium]
MKIRRKTSECANCKSLLNEVYNYCPICGQENTINTVSFNMLVADFFNTFFALDSKFAKSVKPFLFQPGFLTNQYLDGKRVTFAHPLRFYLIISLFFFFVFSIATKKSIGDNPDKAVVMTSVSLDKIDGLDAVELAKLKEVLGKSRIKTIERDLKGAELINIQKALDRNLTKAERSQLIMALDSTTLRSLKLIPELQILDSLKNSNRPLPLDSATLEVDTISTSDEKSDAEGIDINLDEGDPNIFKVIGMIDYEKIEELKNDLTISDNQIYDSLKLEKLSSLEEHIVRQIIRVNRTDETLFAEFITKNLPLMMLLLIPIFAVVLKLLYVRRKYLYIMHLIHALHLHTFAYFFYGVGLIVITFFVEDEDLDNYIGISAFLIVSTYAFISFLRVYKQHWFKTLIKFNLTGAIYITCIFVFFLAELLISFLLF